jgi:hypothetical protein
MIYLYRPEIMVDGLPECFGVYPDGFQGITGAWNSRGYGEMSI